MHCNMISETLELSLRASLDLQAQKERPPRGRLSEIRSESPRATSLEGLRYSRSAPRFDPAQTTQPVCRARADSAPAINRRRRIHATVASVPSGGYAFGSHLDLVQSFHSPISGVGCPTFSTLKVLTYVNIGFSLLPVMPPRLAFSAWSCFSCQCGVTLKVCFSCHSKVPRRLRHLRRSRRRIDWALTDKATLVLEKLPDGKIKVTSNSFVEDKVVLPDQVLEVRHFEGKIRIARKDRLPDAGDPPRTPSTYDPYGGGDEL